MFFVPFSKDSIIKRIHHIWSSRQFLINLDAHACLLKLESSVMQPAALSFPSWSGKFLRKILTVFLISNSTLSTLSTRTHHIWLLCFLNLLRKAILHQPNKLNLFWIRRKTYVKITYQPLPRSMLSDEEKLVPVFDGVECIAALDIQILFRV